MRSDCDGEGLLLLNMQKSIQTHLKKSNSTNKQWKRNLCISTSVDSYIFRLLQIYVQSVGLWQNKHKNVPLKCLLIAPSCVNKWTKQRTCRYHTILCLIFVSNSKLDEYFFFTEKNIVMKKKCSRRFSPNMLKRTFMMSWRAIWLYYYSL